MAWTSSAGPGDGFVLATGDDEQGLGRKLVGLGRSLSTSRPRQLALVTAAHLASLAIVAPLVGHNPVIAIPILIGLAVSCATLARPQDGLQPDCVGQPFTPDSLMAELDRDHTVPTHHRTLAALEVTAAQPRLFPTEVSSELRAELMARVSHELRTPLNAVMGFSDLMGHQLFGPLGHPRYEEYVTHIRESSQKLLKSAEDTLAMTSLMAKSAAQSDREALDLDGVVNSACSAVALDAGRRSISTMLALGEDAEIIANRRALRQALVNILTEAIERAENGAEIMLATHSRDDKLTLTISLDRVIAQSGEAHASLPMCLARTLLELDGYRLVERHTTCGDWSAAITLDRAIQRDFFAPSMAM